MDRQSISFEFAYRKVLESILFSGEIAPTEDDLVDLANHSGLQVNELIHMHHIALAGYIKAANSIDADRLIDAGNLLADLIQLVQTPPDAPLPILPAHIQTEQHTLLAEEATANPNHMLGKVMESVFDRLPVALLVTGMDGMMQYVNAATCQLIGLSRADILTRPIQDFIPPDLYHQFCGAFAESKTLTTALQIYQQDGMAIDVVGSVQIVQEADRQKMVICLIDISAQKQAERELERNRQLIRFATEEINDIVLLCNGEQIEYVSSACERILGYQIEDVKQIFPMENFALYEREYAEKAAQSDRFTMNPYKLYRANGEQLWVQASIRIPEHTTDISASTLAVLRDVTEQHNLFLQLQQNEQRYRALFEKSHDAIFLLNLDGTWVDFNQSALDMLGYTREELLQTNYSDIIAPEDHDSSWSQREKILSGATVPIYSRKLLKKDGSRVICELSVALVRDEAGNPMHTQTIARDVTETYALLSSLEEKHYFIDQITDAIPDTIYVMDIPSGQVPIYINRSLSSTMGYEENLKIDENMLARVIHPDDLAAGVLSHNRFLLLTDNENTITTEFRMRHANGYWEWVERREKAFKRDQAGNVTQVIGMARKVTQRRQLEEFLRLSEQAINASPVAVMIADVSQSAFPIISVNPAFTTITGYQETEVIGKECLFLQTADQEQTALVEIQQAIENGAQCSVIVRSARKDGSLFWSDLRLSPIFSWNGQITRYVLMISDISTLMDIQEQREKTLQMAQEANQLKNRFISMASHEFRTPLAVIRSSAETLHKYYERLDAEQREKRFMNIDAQVTRITSMLDDVLILGKLESSNVMLSRMPIEFGSWLQEFLQEFRLAYPGYELDIRVPQEITIYADKIFLRQIVSNLLSNAVKYSGDSRVVQVIVALPEQQFELRVRDYGIGIPAEDVERLFKDFQRASNVGNIQGTGLGLAIVDRAVKLHGGQISVASTLGEGTTFTVRMPILK